jgi:hypothetical protein
MNEFTPTSLPVTINETLSFINGYECPYSRCRYEHSANRLKLGQPRCKQCGVVIEWVEEQS